MAKICFPHYERGDFESLKEAYKFLKDNKLWRENTLFDIVRYNVCYRNHYRKYGFYALMALLLYDECLLAKDVDSIKYLSKSVKHWNIADYNIQCYNINDEIRILGQTFKGLKDIMAHCEIRGRECYSGFECYVPNEYTVYRDIHVGEIYERYPVFDSYDACDDRCYRNFIFHKESITKQDMKKTFSATLHKSNFCMVHENIDCGFLPILYYNGEGDYMLLASMEDGWKEL